MKDQAETAGLATSFGSELSEHDVPDVEHDVPDVEHDVPDVDATAVARARARHGTGEAGQVLLASCVVLVTVIAPLTMHRYRTRE